MSHLNYWFIIPEKPPKGRGQLSIIIIIKVSFYHNDENLHRLRCRVVCVTVVGAQFIEFLGDLEILE